VVEYKESIIKTNIDDRVKPEYKVVTS